MKKLLSNSMLLAVLMLFTGIPASAYDFISDGIPYNILSEEDRTVEVTYLSYQKSWKSGDVVIPKKVMVNSKTYTVTAIGGVAFKNCDEITSITLPNSLTEIEGAAFSGCTSLTSITLPNSLTEIGQWAFNGCTSLTSITLPNSLTEIYQSAFGGCTSLTCITLPNSLTKIREYVFRDCSSLTSITLSNSLTSIGDYAFEDCTSLTTITLPNSLTKINKRAFDGCTNLENINVETGNNAYSSIDGVLYDNGATTLIVCPQGKTSAPKIPETLISIGNYAFEDCTSLTSITLPNSLTSIGNYAFEDCTSLTTITLPNSLTSIGNGAFWSCTSLTSITLSNSLNSIGDAAFWSCTSLTSITLPNSLTEIGGSAFGSCTSLTSITLPNSLTSIGESAFYKCTSLTSITLSKSLTKIGESAFEGCTELENIMNQSAVPVECNPKFADEVLKNAVLYVPTGTLAEYEKVDPWRNFWNIEEMDFSGIEEIEAGNDSDIRLTVNGGVLTIDGIDSGENIAVYDMQGRCVYCGTDRCIDNLAAGIYVLRAGHKILKFAI